MALFFGWLLLYLFLPPASGNFLLGQMPRTDKWLQNMHLLYCPTMAQFLNWASLHCMKHSLAERFVTRGVPVSCNNTAPAVHYVVVQIYVLVGIMCSYTVHRLCAVRPMVPELWIILCSVRCALFFVDSLIYVALLFCITRNTVFWMPRKHCSYLDEMFSKLPNSSPENSSKLAGKTRSPGSIL
jgi:hypothetical protein